MSKETSDGARRAAQWLGIVAFHAIIIGTALRLSPQARQVFSEIVEAALILPPPPPEALPDVAPKPLPVAQKPPPVQKRPRPPAPVLTARPSVDIPTAAFPVAATPAVPETDSAPAAPALTPPTFNADYLDNPPPLYPSMSRRLGETGRVLLRVLVSADGRAERVEIKTSSGFERLDHAARDAVVGWRFTPARRGDERVAAWVLVPISFVM